MRKALVAGNWKMNGSKVQAESLVSELLAGYQAGAAELILCPPVIYLAELQQQLAGSGMQLGGQNCNEHEQGAYTGEISAAMLMEFGCQYVILGHSERRALYNESDELIAERFLHARQQGLTPILCVGETLEQREAGTTLEVIFQQLDAILSRDIQGFADAVVAYEPVWAIGTGRTASPEQAQEVHQAIRARVAEADSQHAEQLSIIYGGSVNAANAAELFVMADIDGGLVGGASLKAQDFLSIYRAACGS